jgi:hypothetical protein
VLLPDEVVSVPETITALPEASIVNLLKVFVANPSVLTPDKYIPFAGIVLLVGIKLCAVFVPAEVVSPPETIVTAPVAPMVSLDPLFVANARVLTADKYIPLDGIVALVGIKL